MVTLTIYSVLLVAIIASWLGARQTGIVIFAISFVIAIGWFMHHITATLGLEL